MSRMPEVKSTVVRQPKVRRRAAEIAESWTSPGRRGLNTRSRGRPSTCSTTSASRAMLIRCPDATFQIPEGRSTIAQSPKSVDDVAYVDEVARLGAVAVDPQRAGVDSLIEEGGDHGSFKACSLARSIDVRWPRDRVPHSAERHVPFRRKLVQPIEGIRLGARQLSRGPSGFAVNGASGGDEDEFLSAGSAGRGANAMRADHVDRQVAERMAHGSWNTCLRGEMEHDPWSPRMKHGLDVVGGDIHRLEDGVRSEISRACRSTDRRSRVLDSLPPGAGPRGGFPRIRRRR